jgi:hypothetical protein
MIVFNASHDPLHLQVFPQVVTQEILEAHFDRIESYFRQRERAPMAIITDARGPIASNARQQQRAAVSFERLSAMLADSCVAHAMIMDSAIVRGALIGILWVKRPPWPIKVFGDIEAADEWIRQRFAEEGLTPPNAPPGWWASSAASQKP